ncbi:hypothetical protein SFRURICE_005173 [Spodoptera frugiperda]|nr:hypothetical protein SFRURICE_005173 [Spodoptera frugiperda]
MTTDKIRKDKNQNIQVFIRLRPLNQRERDIKSLGVIEVVNNREVVVRQSQQTNHTKKFTFDRAFAPNASQLQVYQEVVSPLIEEVLNGYNCTVFAYGQTGTGKTHTMVGEHTGTDTHWQNDPLAGIIPRALSQLFDELRLTNTEYTVRVSYLELYNEELFDLLSTSEDNSKLRIYEDVTRKGSNIVNGLEEVTVFNKNEVYKIMAQGQERKRVASTLMNAQSSRSHTVFTIVVHMKENSPEGEELMKIGKLNLVDLAGSENISKAGSDNPAKKERARECVNINQSLLTLGRVITALVERHPHIPYRESKLTRILQESLGGRTKTSIIATISPGHKDLEETMSTLEYAHRAKNIQNKPEVNQKMTKKAILKEYAEEIDRLKRDLQATRDKNGVYLASDTFAEMTLKEEEQRKEIQELLLKKRAMEEEKEKMEAVFQELNETLETKNNELATTVSQLDNTKKELATTSKELTRSRQACEEQQVLVSAHCSTEVALGSQARELLATADVATTHVACLHDAVDKRKNVESTNLEITRTYREESEQQRGTISTGVKHFADTVHSAFTNLQEAMDSYTTSSTQTQEQNKQQLANLVQMFMETVNEVKTATSESQSALSESSAGHLSALQGSVAEHRGTLRQSLAGFLQHFATSLQQAHNVDVKGNVANFVQQWESQQANRRKRVANFTAHEKHLLAQLIKRRPIVLSKVTDGKSVAKKQVAWQLITQEFNSSVNVHKRETITLKRAWDNMKAVTRKARAERRDSSTNGAGPPAPPLSPQYEPIITVVEEPPTLNTEAKHSFDRDTISNSIDSQESMDNPDPLDIDYKINSPGANQLDDEEPCNNYRAKNNANQSIKRDDRVHRPTDYIRREAILRIRHLENKKKVEMQILETQLEIEQIKKRAALLEEERNKYSLEKAKLELEEMKKCAADRVSSLQRVHSGFSSRAETCVATRAQAERSARDQWRAHKLRRANKTQACLAEMQEESVRLEKLLTQQLSDIETERAQTEQRLQEWMEEKRRLLEEELARHVASEKQALEDRLAKKVTEIELQKKMLQERMERYKEWEQIQMEADREEMEMAERELEESDKGREDCVKDIKKYSKEFEEGTNAISVDMEIFSKNVVEVVEHINNEMLRALDQTRVQVEGEVSKVVSADEATCLQLTQSADVTVKNLLDTTKHITEQLVNKIESNTGTALQLLRDVCDSTRQLVCTTHSLHSTHSASCTHAREQVATLQEQLYQAIARHQQLENRYLSNEYKLYSPTGKTPSRVEYRYPRVLAATSPHDRLLARFRAMRQNSTDDDCVVVESDTETSVRQASDSECSSEDSAHFLAPSPPEPRDSRDAREPRDTRDKLVKSTSETDILYTIRKLPAPSSHKKPLTERNAN